MPMKPLSQCFPYKSSKCASLLSSCLCIDTSPWPPSFSLSISQPTINKVPCIYKPISTRWKTTKLRKDYFALFIHMGFIPTEESKKLEIDEFQRMLVACAGLNRRKDEEEFSGLLGDSSMEIDDYREQLVCVTSGVSFLGLAIVDRLLSRGYSVRIIVDNEEDMEKLRELEGSMEMRSGNRRFSAVLAKLTDVGSLSEAFEGCRGVFHTSAFTDPAGVSGYTKPMADIEVKASENVIKGCARTSSVRSCVLTSSLLACVWRDDSPQNISSVINHESWSDESLCIDRKLWYALGKLRAEKAAWRTADEYGLKLVTICPGLITGPKFLHRNPTATIAYLKGGQEMFANGLLATVDVIKLAEAHACVFQNINKTASGRYICFDRVIESRAEGERLALEVGIHANKICGYSSNYNRARFNISDRKLFNLMSRSLRSCYNQR
ncbi:hypothetical protein K2173_014257 [Erythroxylum novogranatense]|uniref:3-beta hydroxysteroid dehydrogenase/isomerase domain-containing protein n=1 Tax=Erythroxylum novogranatense TaxID=1862640 RepID=A0AAV8SDS2_9ROSI|nr:hypothetical protein K2173_014257 [Erythroxylum novogranatense]